LIGAAKPSRALRKPSRPSRKARVSFNDPVAKLTRDLFFGARKGRIAARDRSRDRSFVSVEDEFAQRPEHGGTALLRLFE
jgi:hypothetical protein